MSPDDRRAAIVEAALPLIVRHGADVTTKQIAAAAGIAEGTIFRVFPDKPAVINAVLAKAFDPSPTIAALDAVDRTLPLVELISAVVEILRERLDLVWRLMGALRMFASHGDGGYRPPRPQHEDDPTLRATEQILQTVAGQLRLSPAKAAQLLRLWVFSGAHPRITHENPLTTAEIVSTLLDGIRIPELRCQPTVSAGDHTATTTTAAHSHTPGKACSDDYS